MEKNYICRFFTDTVFNGLENKSFLQTAFVLWCYFGMRIDKQLRNINASRIKSNVKDTCMTLLLIYFCCHIRSMAPLGRKESFRMFE